MERGDIVISLNHCHKDKNYDDSSSLDSYLHHFADDMEIVDEVTVTDFPYHGDTDHSYISTSRDLLCSNMYDHDCISEESSLPSEFHELFDCSDYPTFTFDLQEQIIESKSDSSPIIESHLWMSQEDVDLENCDNDMSSRCETLDKFDWNSSYHEQEQNSHTGLLNPHKFVQIPGYRRFCLGLQTIVTKVKTLMSKTGAQAEFRAEFESQVITCLDNAEKMLKFPQRSPTKEKSQLKNDSKVNDPMSNVGQDDHIYAATRSTVRDHQYNEVTTTNNLGKKVEPMTKAYIPTRYARERCLRKSTTTIYTKIQRLIHQTGAKMTLSIHYQGIVITPKNYRELEQMLEKCRPKLKKYNTDIVVQNSNEKETFLSSVSERNGEAVMKVSLPHGRTKSHSFNIEFLKIDKNKNLQTVVETDHDYDSQSLHERKENETTMEHQGSDNLSENSSSSTQSRRSFSQFSSPSSPPSIISVEEISMSDARGGDTIRSFDDHYSFGSSVPKIQCSHIPSPPLTMEASTNTNPLCSVCGNSQVSVSTMVTFPKFPNWIRCAHSLCHYLVHPFCIGLFVINSQHLQFLPPYFCPTHREDVLFNSS